MHLLAWGVGAFSIFRIMLVEIKFTEKELIKIQKILEHDQQPLTMNEIKQLIRRLIHHKSVMI